ncbi:MAG: 5-bromo-4-chloroindolyl phosphate hydrolysis family protein, partial [Clostridia bacterium]|nr:5-bromo-4-chloroindolyl phosphate hydrolysis family protein [Clostridia bacterium]
LVPSLAISAVAYGAGTLIFKDRSKIDYSTKNTNLYEILKNAKSQTTQIFDISKQLEDRELIANVQDICNTSNKIIDTLSKNPGKLSQVNNFINYYLPVTIKILQRYDEIENQKLNSEESQKFMKSVRDMIAKIKEAFHEQLNNMYQAEIIDTDAELKVFEEMLKSDGFLGDINIKK